MTRFLAILVLSGCLHAESAREKQLESNNVSLSLAVSRLSEQLLEVRKDNRTLRQRLAATPAMRNRVEELIQSLQVDIPRAAQLSLESTRAEVLTQTAEGFERQTRFLILSDCGIMLLLATGLMVLVKLLTNRVDRDGVERARLLRMDLDKARSDASEAQKTLTRLVSEIAQALQSKKQEQE